MLPPPDRQDNQSYDPLLDPISPHETPQIPSQPPIDEVLTKLVLAVAAFRRAGPHYARKSSAFLFFARGSWSLARYTLELRQAGLRLPRQVCVERDVGFAERLVGEALVVLRREGLSGDLRDLEWALRQYWAGGFPL